MANSRLRGLSWWMKWAKKEWAIAALGFSLIIFLFTLISDSWSRRDDSKLNNPFDHTHDLVDLTLLRNAKNTGAFCLEGSLPGYHFQKGFGSGSNNWLLHVEGGGWCNTVSSCSLRKFTRLGSSKYMESQVPFSGILGSDPSQNPAYPMGVDKNANAEFAYGTGHINPKRATNPGLVYDAGEIGCVNFLCGQGYSYQSLRLVTGDKSSCSQAKKKPTSHLNYPSFTLSSTSKSVVPGFFPRTVKNVGSLVSTHKAIVNAPTGLKIEVTLNVHSFKSLGQTKFFSIKVIAEINQSIISGSLIWFDGVHQVRSPVVAHVSS